MDIRLAIKLIYALYSYINNFSASYKLRKNYEKVHKLALTRRIV